MLLLVIWLRLSSCKRFSPVKHTSANDEQQHVSLNNQHIDCGRANKSRAALYHDKFEVVQASILGSILVNLLLILGISILAGSFYNHEQRHDQDEAQGLACLLSVSVFSLLVPVGILLPCGFSDTNLFRMHSITLLTTMRELKLPP